MFMDSQGEPWQELSCVVYSLEKEEIYGVYLNYAKCDPDADDFGRLHSHGLDLSFINMWGEKDETALIDSCKDFLNEFEVQAVYVTNVDRFVSKFDYVFKDIELPSFVQRRAVYFHLFAKYCKENNKRFHGISCNTKRHSYFKYKSMFCCKNKSDFETYEMGYQCALANVHEMLMYFIAKS